MAIELDRQASFIPPPLNLIVFVLFVLFNIVEFVLNIIPSCGKACGSVDLSLYFMPLFMRRRTTQLDESLVGRTVEVLTSKGLVTGEISFGKEAVMLNRAIIKKHIWKVNILELGMKKIINLSQFDVIIDSQFVRNEKQEAKVW